MGALLHGCPCGLLLLCLGQEEHGRCWGLVLLHIGIELSDQESQGGGKGRCVMTAASKGHGLHVSERVSVLQAEVPYASAFHAALPCS